MCYSGAPVLLNSLTASTSRPPALQGGMPGAERLRDSQPLTDLVAQQKAADKFHAAICATPAVAFEPQGEPQARSRGSRVARM